MFISGVYFIVLFGKSKVKHEEMFLLLKNWVSVGPDKEKFIGGMRCAFPPYGP
jgi:hypothetical protein